jgi:aminopeptidase
MQGYTPPPEILARYASVLVDFALGEGRPIKPGAVVMVRAPEAAKPLYVAICKAVWRAGGNVIHDFRPDDAGPYNLTRSLYEQTTDVQRWFFPEGYYRALADEIDHLVAIRANADPHALATVDPAAVLRRNRAMRPFNDWLDDKENAGAFSWTLAIYGTAGMAAEAGLSLERYWQQIIAGCQLDHDDPLARWAAIDTELKRRCALLDALRIQELHVLGVDADLRIRLGGPRRWVAAASRNIPSYEVFTCPDWRGTDGWIRINQPLYRFGSLVEGIELEFSEGHLTKAAASRNQQLLAQIVASPGGDRLGEFSLTDARLSAIDQFMADTLFDENHGGPFGNTHVALGNAIQEAYDGDAAALTRSGWHELGFNVGAAVHTDVVSTSDRTVTATLADGSTRTIYAHGQFTD